jgi:uncharacterized protein YeaO (DUF488 family)
MAVNIKRAYEPYSAEDGHRVLVDRIWPRGLSKPDLRIDEWMRDVAPSTGLRRWFGHDAVKWDEFVRRYREELDAIPDQLGALASLAAEGNLTLVYGAKDKEHNQAVVLRSVIEEKVKLGR